MLPGKLIAQIIVQRDAIGKVLEITARQREALKTKDMNLLNDLLRELNCAQNDAISAETERARLADIMAKELGCEPRISSIIVNLQEQEASKLLEVSSGLEKTVKLAKAEMQILNNLVEESKSLNEMLINEWRRLGGSTPRAGLDLKG